MKPHGHHGAALHLLLSGVAGLVFGVATLVAGELSPGNPLDSSTQGATVTLPHATQFDFTSRVNGQAYRIMVSVPKDASPQKRYPIIYVLDGYWYFLPAANAVPKSPGNYLQPAIVVGIGYPTDDWDELIRRRTYDLVPAPVTGISVDNMVPGTGGLDDFVQILLQEVKPFVEERYAVDTGRQAIFGMSNGGLAVLRLLFRHPDSFQTFIASSPAIFHHNRMILADEAQFAARVRRENLRVRLLVTTAVDEQYRGSDLALLASDGRFVDNAAELADRLSALDPAKLRVVYTSFPGEDHKSVSLAALARALRYALSDPPR